VSKVPGNETRGKINFWTRLRRDSKRINFVLFLGDTIKDEPIRKAMINKLRYIGRGR